MRLYRKRTVELLKTCARMEGFASGHHSGYLQGKKTNQDTTDAAVAAVARAFWRNSSLQRQVKLLSSEVFVRGHDGTEPLGGATLSNGLG